MDEAASASMGTRKATQAFSSSSKVKLPQQNKYSIAEIPPFSPIKESGVRDKLRPDFKCIHIIQCSLAPLPMVARVL